MKSQESEKKAKNRIIHNILLRYKAVAIEIEAGHSMGYTGNLNPKLNMLMGAIEKLIISIKRKTLDKDIKIQKQHELGYEMNRRHTALRNPVNPAHHPLMNGRDKNK